MHKKNYTNVQLAEKIGVKHVSSLYKIGERFYWDRTRMPYGRRWIWHLSDQDVKDYFDEASGKRESLQAQIDAAITVSNALDMMSCGKVLLRGSQDLKDLKPAYVHGEGKTIAETVSANKRPLFYYDKLGCRRAASADVEARVRALILRCLQNEVYSAKVILDELALAKLAVHEPSGDRLLEDTIKRIARDIAHENDIEASNKQAIIKRLHSKGMSLKDITRQIGASYQYVFACVRKLKAGEMLGV